MFRTIIFIIAAAVLLYCIYKEINDIFLEAVNERVKRFERHIKRRQAKKLHELKAENERLRFQLQHIPIEIKAIGYNEEE
jgi:hypothetical protein